MKRKTRLWALAALTLLAPVPGAWGVEPASGVNSAGVIEFPTALDQTRTHTFHASLEIFDIGEPDLRLQNVRYGYQLGNFQLLTDIHVMTTPERDVDFGEIRAKLKVLPLDEFATDVAIGLLGREAKDEAGEERLDDSSASLFAVITSQFHPLDDAGPLLVNFYLDNVFASLGWKFEFYQFVQFIGEVDFLHSLAEAEDRTVSKVGIEMEGEQNFYFQLYYSDRNENFLLQLGTGF